MSKKNDSLGGSRESHRGPANPQEDHPEAGRKNRRRSHRGTQNHLRRGNCGTPNYHDGVGPQIRGSCQSAEENH